jgi:hypothetical protein
MKTLSLKMALVAICFAFMQSFQVLNAQGQSQWRTNGNNANGNNQFLGTTNNTDLTIKTDNQTRMLVKSDGAVEINSLSGTKPAVVAVNPDGSLFRYENPVDSIFDCSTKLYRATGNYLTPDCFIGSTNKEAFRMYTNNTERMRLSSTGDLGIGTTTPETPLHFFSSTNAELRIQGATNNALPTLGFAGGTGNQTIQLSKIKANLSTTTFLPEMVFEVNNSQGLNTVQQVLRMDFKTADFRTRLGVGMAAQPNEQLSVNGSTILTETNNPANWLRMGHDGANAYIEHKTTSASSNNPSRLFINQNGGRTDFGGDVVLTQNLGLGTTTFVDPSNGKDYRLSVDGRIRANEVKVYSGWADYVFESDYELMPLSEVEAFIAQNGHLPGLPSAAQVAEQGVDVGETQAKLLEKIEELTLHLIRLEKENEVLKAEMGLK